MAGRPTRDFPPQWVVFDAYRWERVRRLPEFKREAQRFIADLGCPVGDGGTIRVHADAFPGPGKALSPDEFRRSLRVTP